MSINHVTHYFVLFTWYLALKRVHWLLIDQRPLKFSPLMRMASGLEFGMCGILLRAGGEAVCRQQLNNYFVKIRHPLLRLKYIWLL